MSERYGTCRTCEGQACDACGWTGFGGGIEDLENPLRVKNVIPMKKRKTVEELIEIAVRAVKDEKNE